MIDSKYFPDLLNTWELLNQSCPKCGSKNTEYNSGMVLTSYPPQYNCRCKDCGEHFFSGQCSSHLTHEDPLDDMWKHDQSILNTPKIADPLPGQQWSDPFRLSPPSTGNSYGWICPKCGRVIAPHMDYCKFCSSSTGVTVTTSKLDDNDKLNIEKLVEDWKSTATPVDPFIYRTKFGDAYYNWLTTTNNEMNGTNNANISVQSNTIDIKDTYRINKTMADKFLEESDSVFEATDKYKEWEKYNTDENSELYSKS